MITPRPPELVEIAAMAGGVADRAGVVRSMDIDVVHLLAERARSADDAFGAAALLLVGIAASRPFELGNDPSAWLAAAHVLDRNGHRLAADVLAARGLVAGARDGSADEATVADVLRSWARPTRRRRLSAWATRPRVPRPEPCGRPGCVRCWRAAARPAHEPAPTPAALVDA